jgi:hypothetical protein
MATQRIAQRNRQTISSRKRAGGPKARSAGDLEKGFYVAVVSFAVVLTAMLAHGAVYTTSRRPAMIASHPLPSAHSAVFGRALLLQSRYDSRPYWHGSKLAAGAAASRETADLAIEHLIPCESGGKIVDRLDTNGKMSYGILQFQDWREWERVSGMRGDPDDPDDAIRMAEWGIEHGMIDHWTCARILGEIAQNP